MTIKDWPIDETPRERLLSVGAEALSEAELLAIFLQSGTKGKTAIDLARELLKEYKSLNCLLNAKQQNLVAYPGIGAAKYAMLRAALELGRRCLKESLKQNLAMSTSEEAQNFLISKLSHQRQEVFACLFLNNSNRLIEYKELFFGTINAAPLYPRIVAEKALEYNAAAIISI